jgi:NAD(P)-dependent dehydrogenase (short-subunit alcohol dehydrogenase family)
MKGALSGLLEGKAAVVTGGATGIGEAVCKVFARQGAAVVVNGLPGDPVGKVVDEIRWNGGRAVGVTEDVGTRAGAEACVRAAIEDFGRLDVVAANAGLFPEQTQVDAFPLERQEELLHHNVGGVYHITRAALPELRKTRGNIITAASEAGLVGIPETVSYGATKGWVIAFTRGVAAEQARFGVRANAVAPGPIDTEMTRPTKGEMTVKNALLSVEAVPLWRRGTPEEVANVYLFLASDLASYVNGAVYTVDGGATATQGLPGLEAKSPAKKAPEGTVDLEHQYAGRGTADEED